MPGLIIVKKKLQELFKASVSQSLMNKHFNLHHRSFAHFCHAVVLFRLSLYQTTW